MPIVDCAMAHDCPYTKNTYYLVMYNALYVPGMEENLVLLFTIRRQDNEVNDVPKIKLNSPSKLEHCLILDDKQVHVPLQLNGAMSYISRHLSQRSMSTMKQYSITN